MPMIKCQDCGNEISDRVPTCSECGARQVPTLTDVVGTDSNIEPGREASSGIKLHTLIAVLFIFVEVVWLVVTPPSALDGVPAVPLLLIALGIFWYFVTRFNILGHHK